MVTLSYYIDKLPINYVITVILFRKVFQIKHFKNIFPLSFYNSCERNNNIFNLYVFINVIEQFDVLT